MLKRFLPVIFTLLCLAPRQAAAFERPLFIAPTFAVREITPTPFNPQTTLDAAKLIYYESTPSATPVTWLLSTDTLYSSTTSAFFTQIASPDQELAALIEVTPELSSAAVVNYQSGSSRYSPQSLMLNGYSPEDRLKLIDAYFNRFFDLFGRFPRTVAAPYFDSYSLQYLADNYPVELILTSVFPDSSSSLTPYVDPDLAPQIEAAPLSPVVYYPSRLNAAAPAQNSSQKIPLPQANWNPSSPHRLLTFSLFDQLSFFPDSANLDLLFSDLTDTSFNEFAFISLGFDNTIPPATAKTLAKNWFAYLSADRPSPYTLIPARDFGAWYKARYPEVSPSSTYRDPTTGRTSYTSPFYQLSLIPQGAQTQISDLVVFNNFEAEPFRDTFNQLPYFRHTNYPLSLPDKLYDFDLSTLSPSANFFTLKLSSSDQFINLNYDSLHSSAELDLTSAASLTKNNSAHSYTFTPSAPFRITAAGHLLNTLKVVTAALLFLALIGLSPRRLLTAVLAHKLLSFTLVVIAAVPVLTTIKSGLVTDYGLSFWGAHEHDAVFHLTLIESFRRQLFPLLNPNFLNVPVYNYHIAYDLFAALLSKFLLISPLELYFRYLPVLISLSLVFLVYRLGKALGWSDKVSLLAAFFSVTLGSLGHLLDIYRHGSFFGGESLFWSMQSVSLLINPPYALSLLFLLSVLLLFNRFIIRPHFLTGLNLVILLGLLIQVKAYASILAFAALGLFAAGNFLAGLISFVKHRHLRPVKSASALMAVLFAALALSLLILLPTYRQGGTVFVFQPLWFVRSLIESQDRLNWQTAARAWNAYQVNGQYPKFLLLSALSSLIFIIGNLGVRLISLYYFLTHPRRPLVQVIALISLIGIVFPLLFVQQGNTWNSIQFMYYSLFFLSIFTAPVIAKALINCRTLPRFALIIIPFSFLAFPTTIGSLNQYLSPVPSTRITHSELRALDALKNLPSGMVIVSHPSQTKGYQFNYPLPLLAFVPTGYVSALTAKPVVFADDVNLEIMRYDYKTVKRQVQQLYNTSDPKLVTDLLQGFAVNYLYQVPYTKLRIDPASVGLIPVFDNGLYTIYRHNL